MSHFSTYFFKSGTSVVNEPAWWSLSYPKLTPNVISNICKNTKYILNTNNTFISDSVFTNEKQKIKILKMSVSDSELFTQILHKHVKSEDLLTPLLSLDSSSVADISEKKPDDEIKKVNNPICLNQNN